MEKEDKIIYVNMHNCYPAGRSIRSVRRSFHLTCSIRRELADQMSQLYVDNERNFWTQATRKILWVSCRVLSLIFFYNVVLLAPSGSP